MARAAVWLASAGSDHVTGTTIFVDGDMSLYPEFHNYGRCVINGRIGCRSLPLAEQLVHEEQKERTLQAILTIIITGLSMRWMFALLVGVTMSQAVSARAQDAAVYVATYIEAAPEAAKKAAAMLKAEAAASRRDDGCRRIQVLAEIGRGSRFVLLEVWSDQNAFAAHRDSDHARHFRQQLGAVEAAPPDERVGDGLWLGPAPKAAPAQALWVVTHVDVPPPSKDDASAMLKRLGGESVREPGNLRFEVAQQVNRPNHFTVSETWRGRGAFDAHQTAAHTRQFRDQLGPLLGALYDQRIYRKVD